MLVTAFLLATIPSSPQDAVPREPELVVRDVTLVDTERGALVPHQDVHVRAARIVAVGAAGAALPASARVIEGAGRYLMPGLVDAHVHASERDLALFLANGVTAVRELNGSPAHLELRARIAAGELLGPRMKVASPLLAGEPQRWRHLLLSEPVAAAEQALLLADEGYDALKVYDGLGLEVYEALAAVARERSLPLVGHIPRAVGLERVLAAGQQLEHSEQLLQATVGHTLERARIPAIVASLRAAGVSVTPTLAAQRILAGVKGPEYAARFAQPELAYVERDTLAWWESLRRPGAEQHDPGAGPGPYHAFQAELVLALARAGVPLLVGTDTPNPMLVPGFAIHAELAALVEAGLTHAEVLRAATVRAAELLGFETQGRLAPGQLADLVLLEGDPFASLEVLRRPLGVCAAGRWLTRDELAALLAPLARDE